MSLLKVLEHYEIELNSQNKTCCPFHQEKSPSFTVYPENDSFWCFGCGAGSDVIDFVKLKEGVEFKEALKIVSEITGMKEEEILDKKEKEDKQDKIKPLPKEFIEEFFKDKGYKSNNYRGIKDEYNQFFGHLSKLDDKGNVVAQYYPETYNGKLVGYKCRNHPKDFSHGKVGVTGGKCELSGQVKFKAPHKYCLIVGGECYDESTQIMTDNGWKNFYDLKSEDLVMQVQNGIGSFVKPERIVCYEKDEELIRFSSRQLDLLVTENHKMHCLNSKGEECEFLASEGFYKHYSFRKNVEVEIEEDYPVSDSELRMIVAINADSKVDKRKTKEDVAHFSFIKDRKIIRLKELLVDLGWEYSEFDKSNRDWKCGRKYHTFNVRLPEHIKGKQFDNKWITSLSLRQRLLVLNELMFWDGNDIKDRNSFEFSSKKIEEADFIQALAVTSGYHCNIRHRSNDLGSWYDLRISREKKTASYQSVEVTREKYKGKVYCVTVPSGFILVRRNNKVTVSGNSDKVAAYQMFMDNQKDREQDDYAAIPVVSPTVGETSCVKQVASQYEWFDMFDNIIIGMDNDDAGRQSAKKIAEVLPKHKVKIATWSLNDPNEMLQKGKSRQFLRDFYNAKEIVSTGVKSSIESYNEVRDFLTAEKIPLPPHLHRVQAAHRGGIRSTGCIGNIIGDTSIGKSFVTDTLLNFWIPLEGITPIIVSIERTAGEFTADLLSIYLKRNLTWFVDGHDATDYLDRPEVAELIDNFLTDDLGRPRFYVIDERDGKLETLQNKMQMAVSKYGTNLFVIDPLTDILRSLGNEAQEEHMMWQKQRKKDGWKIINVLHTRKPTPDKDGKLRKVTEYDALGSSTFVQSSDWNWVINRDKMTTNEVDRNTMTLDIPKVRGGTTGLAAELYYDKETRQHFDKLDYFSKELQKEEEPEKSEEQTTREEYEESHFVMED